MGTKNNPKNRGAAEQKKVLNGKELEPIMFYDVEHKKKYLAGKVSKTNDVICDKNENPLKWDEIN